MGMAFGTGTFYMTLGAGEVSVLDVTDISIEAQFQSIPAPTNLVFAPAIARGTGRVTGSCKSGRFMDNTIHAVTNELMAPLATAYSLRWSVTEADGTTTVVFGLPNIIITGWKITGANNKWIASDISFEAAAAPGTGMTSVFTIT